MSRTKHASKAKVPQQSLTDVGNGRPVFIVGGQRIRINHWAGTGCTITGHRTASRNHAHGGGNF